MISPNQHIILIGVQWSGKGTQAKILVENSEYTLFETGAELRKIASTNTPIGHEIRAIIDQWHYVEARHIRDVIHAFIHNNSGKKLLFDAPIRTREQHDVISPLLWPFAVIVLDLDRKTAIKRLSGRKIDPETGEVFRADFPSHINPKTGNTLITRHDDTPSSIKNRIDRYITETLPLIDVWKQSGHGVYHINADQSVQAVSQDIASLLSS